MPKLAIYVPKKAKKETDRWRKTINFSQVFMRALETEIRERERSFAAGDDEVANAVRHYRQQMSSRSEPLVSLGHAEGVRLVLECRLDPETIHVIIQWADEADVGNDERARIRECLGKANDGLLKAAEKIGYHSGTHPVLEADLHRGVVRGVVDAWERVCEKMKQF